MAALGFLMAPERDIPAGTDAEWFAQFCAWNNGTSMAWLSLRRTLPEDQRPARDWFDSPNLTSNAADYMALNRSEHKEAFRAYVAERHARWLSEGRDPATVFDNGPAEYSALTGTPSALGLDKLISYRGGALRAIPAKKLGWGGVHRLLANRGNLFEFNPELELHLAEEITRAAGGDSLALWTHGHTVQLWLWHAQPPGARPHLFRLSLRLRRPSDRPRSEHVVTALRRAFDGAALIPDWSAVERLLASPEIEVGPWFEAFGLPGADELVPKDGAQLWEALDRAGTALLQDRVPEAADVKRLNALLSRVGDDKVPGKPGKGMARKLFAAAWQLRQAVGLPQDAAAWPSRHRAAQLYWDIVDAPTMEQLTTGQDKKGLGASASLGRLMGCYPAARHRDGWFWALAALEAESANGHAFVASMETLAQAAHTAGFTLVLLPEARQAAFRQAFGLGDGQPEAERGFAAEAFVDLPGLLKADAAEVAGAWLAKSKASGVVVQCERDGTVQVAAWQGGKPASDAAAVLGAPVADLSAAARALDPRGALRALGLGALLGPGEPAPRPEGGDATSAGTLDPARAADWTAAIPRRLGGQGAAVLMRLDVPTADAAYLDELTTDLVAGLKVKARRHGNSIHARAGDGLYPAEVAPILGDLPAGSVWMAGSDTGGFRHVASGDPWR